MDFGGSVQQAVSELTDWVEDNQEPPASSQYEWSPDWELTLAPTAEERPGIQPIVNISADGLTTRAEVRTGEPVSFTANVGGR
jgi:hypothetical protein